MNRFKVLVLVLVSFCAACGMEATAETTDPAVEDNGAAIAQEMCSLMTGCVSSVVSVEECVQIQVDCRDLLDDPLAWDDYMQGCVDLGGCEDGSGGAPGTDFVQCVQGAPRPPECESGRP